MDTYDVGDHKITAEDKVYYSDSRCSTDGCDMCCTRMVEFHACVKLANGEVKDIQLEVSEDSEYAVLKALTLILEAI